MDHIHVDSEAELLHDVGKNVADSLSVLSHCRHSIPGSFEVIVACSGYLARLSLVCKRRKENSDFLHIIGLNIRIESTRTKVAAALFKGSGGEIKMLAAKLGGIISAVHSSAEKVQTDQISMQSQIPQNMESFEGMIQMIILNFFDTEL